MDESGEWDHYENSCKLDFTHQNLKAFLLYKVKILVLTHLFSYFLLQNDTRNIQTSLLVVNCDDDDNDGDDS